MNQALKQRLLGAVVLVALAVIFLPALFNGGRSRELATLKDIPPMPVVAPIAMEEVPQPQVAPENTAPASEMFSMEPKPASTLEKIHNAGESVTPLSKTPGLNGKGAPNAWVLQVGVFSDKAKANQLKKNLQAKGYRAFTRSITRDKKTITRVAIGPEFEQAALTKIKTAVDHDFGVKSIVMKFEP